MSFDSDAVVSFSVVSSPPPHTLSRENTQHQLHRHGGGGGDSDVRVPSTTNVWGDDSPFGGSPPPHHQHGGRDEGTTTTTSSVTTAGEIPSSSTNNNNASSPLRRLSIPASFQTSINRGAPRRNSPGIVVVEDVLTPHQFPLGATTTTTMATTPGGASTHSSGIPLAPTNNNPAAPLPAFARRTSLTVPTTMMNATTPSDTSLGRNSSLCMDDLEDTAIESPNHQQRLQHQQQQQRKQRTSGGGGVSPLPPHYQNQQQQQGHHLGMSVRGQRMRQSLWMHAGGQQATLGALSPGGGAAAAAVTPLSGALSPHHHNSGNRLSGAGSHIVLPAIFLSDATPQNAPLAFGAGGGGSSSKRGWATPRLSAGDELQSMSQLTSSTAVVTTTAVFGAGSSTTEAETTTHSPPLDNNVHNTNNHQANFAPPPAAERRHNSNSHVTMSVIVSMSPTEEERWSPNSGGGGGGRQHSSGSPPAHSSPDHPLYSGGAEESTIDVSGVMMSRKRKVKSSTTTNAVAFHRPWYDLLLVVALLLACGSLCCRMAVSETHLFGFGHKKSVDGLSNLLDVRQRRQAPLRMDPVLGTTVALEHLRSRQALLHTFRSTALRDQRDGLALFGQHLPTGAFSSALTSTVTECVDVGHGGSGLLNVSCRSYANVLSGAPSPLNTSASSTTSFSWNISSAMCPTSSIHANTNSVYESLAFKGNLGDNHTVVCSSSGCSSPASPPLVLPAQLVAGISDPNVSTVVLHSGSSQGMVLSSSSAEAWTRATMGEEDFMAARCLVYPSNLRIGSTSDAPVPIAGLTFFRRQGALFLAEMIGWTAGLVLLIALTRLFFSVQKVMLFVSVAMKSVAHICRDSLAEMRDIDPQDLLQIKLAFCFRGVDIGTVNDYLIAVETKHRDFRSYLPRGLIHRVVALTSNDGSTKGGIGGGRLGSAKGSLKALSPRPRDLDGLQPLISPRGAFGATSPVNSFRNFVGSSGQFSPRLEPVQNPFQVPVMNSNDPMVPFDGVQSANDSPTGIAAAQQAMMNSGNRASGSMSQGAPLLVNSSHGSPVAQIQIRAVSPPLVLGGMTDYQLFRRRTQTTDSGTHTTTRGDAPFTFTSDGQDEIMDEEEEMPNLNEYEGMLVSFGLPGITTANLDRLALSSRSASVLGGGPLSSVAAPGLVGIARRTSEAFANAFLSPLAAKTRRLSGQSALEFSVGASPPQPNHPLQQLPPTISVLGPESVNDAGFDSSVPQSTTIDSSLRQELQLDRSLPTPMNPHDHTVGGVVVPSPHDERSGSVFDVIALPSGAGMDSVHPFQLPSSPSHHNAQQRRGTGNTTNNTSAFIPQYHVTSGQSVNGGVGGGRGNSLIGPGAASPPDRPTSPTTSGTEGLKRRSTNQHANAALAEMTTGPANHMAHAGIRKVTFVVCHLFFGGGAHGASEYLPESSFGMRVQQNGQEMRRARLAAMEKCSDIFLQHAIATCEDFQGVAYRITMSSVIMSFNAFQPCPFHEARGCFAALHLAQELQEHLEEMLDVQTAAGGVRWGICVNSGAAVVGVTGTQQKMAPSIVSDALTIAQTTVKMADIIRCHVLVLEPCYHVSRTQVFCVPVDIVGHEGAQIIVFELKGRQDDFRHLISDYQPFMDGFACLAVHKFDEAEANLQQALAVDHNASRLLTMVRWCRRVQGTGAATLPKPYHRHLPLWDSPELLADQEDLPDDVIEKMQLMTRSEEMEFERPRLLSTLAESIFRGSDRNPSVDQSPFPWSSNRNSVDNTSRKSSNTASMSETPNNQQVPPLSQKGGRVIPVEIVDRKNQTWWRSERLLGQGAFGAVYQGLTQNGALVAMKVLPVNSAEIRLYRSASTATMIPGQRPPLPPHLEEVLKEISLLSQLVHPNIVQYHTSTIMSNYLFIMMEFMSGGTLTRMVQMFGSLPETVVRRFSKDILEGLKFLHSKNIVHRDINPNNVLLTLDGTCKISDFGAAASNLQRRGADAVSRRRFSEETARSSISSGTGTPQFGSPPAASLAQPPHTPALLVPSSAAAASPLAAPFTGDGQVIGTPLFMAPEAARGNATTASDIWGFGVILCYCFSGTYPYPEQDYSTDVVGFLRRLGNDESYGPRIPREAISNPSVLRVIEQCLQRREELRPTAADILMSPFLIL